MQVARGHCLTEALRHLHQQFVARSVAQRIVDIFEAVQIEQDQHRWRACLARLPMRNAPIECAPVGQSGERIDAAEPGKMGFGIVQQAR
jgi:hypothetical protein